METLGNWLAGNWLTNVISLVALLLSVVAIRRSRPRVTVHMDSALMLGAGSKWNGRSVITVTVINDGPVPVHFQRVYLRSAVGAVYGESAPQTQPLPSALPAFGGVGTWYFDRAKVTREAHRDEGADYVEFEAIAESGGKKHRSTSLVVFRSQGAGHVRPRGNRVRSRLKKIMHSLCKPSLSVSNLYHDVDLEAGTATLLVHNRGGGISGPATLELMKDGEDDPLAKVSVGPKAAVPRIPRRKTRMVPVPLVEEDDLTWWLRIRGYASVGVGALTRQDAKGRTADPDPPKDSPPPPPNP